MTNLVLAILEQGWHVEDFKWFFILGQDRILMSVLSIPY